MIARTIDFKALNQSALGRSLEVVSRILPDGKRVGCEWQALNPRRADKRRGSFSVNLNNGRWKDFASDDAGGDFCSLVAFINGTSQIEAAHILEGIIGGS
jgi:hypothetical protein